MGVTGATGSLSTGLPDLCKRVHEFSGNTPIAVGFGVSTREHFLSVGEVAEGVVIGSKIVDVLAAAPPGGPAKREAVRNYCAGIVGRTTDATPPAFKITPNQGLPAGTEVHPTAVITETPPGPGLMDQLDALNTEAGKEHPEVCIAASLLPSLLQS